MIINNDQKSPNFDDRPKGTKITHLVLHYTQTKGLAETNSFLLDTAKKVSAHYVIDLDGTIYAQVAEDKRAWHAGKSFWKGVRQLNDCSIGVELVNGGHRDGLPAYPKAQMDALMTLCKDILARHHITADCIVGHSDIAPDRKEDPGEHFDWKNLADHGIGIFPQPTNLDEKTENALEIEPLLSHIGYETGSTQTAKSLIAFQRRFNPSTKFGTADTKTYAMLRAAAREYTAYRARKSHLEPALKVR